MGFFKPLSSDQAARHLTRYFQQLKAKKPDRPLQAAVSAPKLGLNFTFPSDSTSQPYHIASIGKMFTAVLIQRLAAGGAFSIQDPIHPFFVPAELERLFVFQGADHARQVTIEHLLGHTSGIADYVEGRTLDGRVFLKDVLANPRTRWTPQALLDFTRSRQQAVGAPGQVFNYSDTGYVLLGLLIEKVTGRSFAENLHAHFFTPLGMHDTYLMFYSKAASQPQKEIQPIWMNQQEVSRFESLSCDWAGGGVISTTADLIKFNRALRAGELIGLDVVESMDRCPHKFQPGIYYGLGMMEIRFKDFFFLLGGLPRVRGPDVRT
ncbi:MAG TPA: serine hydrolase domain-containing protein [Anaerolineaceae bacterium]|nr:serine hydrolase domain-containing protein [Anaerolineaceae bacterium]HPN51823.1 serine hydrolase domain-containing protein [Anaerolineaceae bacterium]